VDTVALILAGIFLVNLFIAGWLVTLGLVDRYRRHKVTREVDALERSLAMPSAGRDLLSARWFGGTQRAIAVRERRVGIHHVIDVRRLPALPRLVRKASIGVALASTVLWVAVAVPDLGGRSTITSADDGVSVSFPRVWEVPSYRDEAPQGNASGPRADLPPSRGVLPGVQTDPTSSTATDTTFEGDTVPARVAAEPRSWTAISLAWATVPGAIGYSIERSGEQTPDPVWMTIARVDEGLTTYTDVGLEADTTYWYRIAALTEEGPAPPSDVVSATTPVAPPAATNLTAIETGTTIDLAWVDVEAETAYRIERSHLGTSRWTTIGTTGQDVTTYLDAALSPGVTYRYRIFAMNAGGESAPSNVVSVKIDEVKVMEPPEEPSAPPGGEAPVKDKHPRGVKDAPLTEESPVTEGPPLTEESPETEESSVTEESQ
jgi:hypothetical protein